jgi:hypothetical protein
MNAPFAISPGEAIEREPDPIEIDPQSCETCGCTIEDFEELIYLRAADLIAQWECADPRDRWRHTGEAPPKPSAAPPQRPEPYRPAESTVAAFLYIVGLDDPDYLAAWLAKHSADAPHLLKIWKARQCSPTK